MATVRPFNGITYNSNCIEDYAQVVTPPYDVISPGMQRAYYDRHPHNVIRLILNQPQASDTATDNPHTRAATAFHGWLAQDILQADSQPGFYFTAHDFTVGDQHHARFGIILKVRLEAFEKGIVLPHERTFSKVKSERLGLMKACHANFCPIFALYEDHQNLQANLVEALGNVSPAINFKDENGQGHRLWRIQDQAPMQQIMTAISDERLYIADGHHRYETALNYRDWLTEQQGPLPEAHPANFVMMYVCSMKDPGLIILPAHRMLKAVAADQLDRMLDRAGSYFEIDTHPLPQNDADFSASQFFAALGRDPGLHRIGFYRNTDSEIYLLTLKANTMSHLFGEELPAALLGLDVTVLTRLIFMELLGFDQARLDNEKLIGYASNAWDAVQNVGQGEYDATFILNPTRMSQVRQIAEQGLVMPRKSTYFYPKALSGLVLADLSDLTKKGGRSN